MIDLGFPLKPITTIDFEAPTQSTNGAEEREIIFLSVGRALSSWELVESTFATIYHVLVEFDNEKLKNYGKSFSSIGKSTKLTNAASVFLPKYIPDFSVDKFNILIENYKNAAMRRHEIAHGSVCYLALKGDDKRGCFLCPPSYNPYKTKERNQAFYEEVELRKNVDPFYLYGMNFTYTYQDIDYFNELFEPLRMQAAQTAHLFNMTFITQMGHR